MLNELELPKYKSFIASSKYRELVFFELSSSPRTPKDLSHLTAISQPNISRALKELQKEKLIECLNPDSIKSRYYSTTVLGKQVFNIIKNEPGIDKLLGKKLEERIEDAFGQSEIEYNRNYKLKTSISDFVADFFIPSRNTIIRTKFDKAFDADIAYKIAYECSQLKKTYEGISIVLFLHRNLGQNVKFLEELEKLRNDGYYTILYENDEESLRGLMKSLKTR
jgi:DNA-binding PadR family transcriptional regulator